MLDHIFLDIIGALRRAFDSGFLERQSLEERFQADVLLGDLSWEASYSLPGEGVPPRVRADISLDWPTWSQSAYRSWSIGEPTDDQPEVGIEVILRIQRLVSNPELSMVMAALPHASPPIGTECLERMGPTVEHSYNRKLTDSQITVEVSFEGTYRVEEEAVLDGKVLDKHFGVMGGWIASTLVRLGDLKLEFHPPSTDDEDEDS